jgi:hypothetical protein
VSVVTVFTVMVRSDLVCTTTAFWYCVGDLTLTVLFWGECDVTCVCQYMIVQLHGMFVVSSSSWSFHSLSLASVQSVPNRFPTECDLMLLLHFPVSCSFLCHIVAACAFFILLPLCPFLSFL